MPTTSLYTTSLIGDNMGHFYPNPKFKTITNYDGGDCIAWCIEKKGVIHMANVWVHPETRGEGRGMQMMKEIRNRFPNHQIITDYNKTSKGFWKKVFEAGHIDEVIDQNFKFDWVY